MPYNRGMKTILIFGASGAHGVGGEHGGWADKLKLHIHEQLYITKGQGEACAVYELGIPGENAAAVLSRFEAELRPRLVWATPPETVIVLAVGGNDAKATNVPENFANTPEQYAQTVQLMLGAAKTHAEHVICLGHTPVDETKTNPKRNPNGGLSFFNNNRLREFEAAIRQEAEAAGVTFLPLFAEVPPDWKTRCLYSDGLHPNDAGHQWIFERLRSSVDTVLS